MDIEKYLRSCMTHKTLFPIFFVTWNMPVYIDKTDKRCKCYPLLDALVEQFNLVKVRLWTVEQQRIHWSQLMIVAIQPADQHNRPAARLIEPLPNETTQWHSTDRRPDPKQWGDQPEEHAPKHVASVVGLKHSNKTGGENKYSNHRKELLLN